MNLSRIREQKLYPWYTDQTLNHLWGCTRASPSVCTYVQWRFSPAEEGGSQPWFMTSSAWFVGANKMWATMQTHIPPWPWKMVESDDIPNELKWWAVAYCAAEVKNASNSAGSHLPRQLLTCYLWTSKLSVAETSVEHKVWHCPLRKPLGYLVAHSHKSFLPEKDHLFSLIWIINIF